MLTDYQTLVDSLVRDDAGRIATGERDSAIALGVLRYGKDRPRFAYQDMVSASGDALAMPGAWVMGFSGLSSLEYPVDEIPPVYLAAGAWGVYNVPGVERIMLNPPVGAGATVRVLFTVPHTVDVSTDTIPLMDREAVASYAAAILCDQLSALYSGDSDSTIQSDSVDHNSKASEFAARARVLRQRYFNELGIDPKRAVAAGVVVNLDRTDSQGNDRLQHPRRFR